MAVFIVVDHPKQWPLAVPNAEVVTASDYLTDRRFVEARLPGPTVESLLDAGPGLGDAWPAYLALAPPSVIRDLLEPEHPDFG